MTALAKKPATWRQWLYRPGGIDFILASLARGGGAPLAFAANILIARLLGPKNFGTYITILSAALVAGVMASYGVGPLLTREIAASSKAERRSAVISVAIWAFRFTGLLSICAMVVIMLWLSFGPGSPPSLWVERIAALGIIPVYVFAILVRGMLTGLSRVAKGQVIENVGRNGFLFMGVCILLLIGERHAADILWLQVASFAFAALLGGYWILRALPHSGNSVAVVTGSEFASTTRKEFHRSLRKSSGHFFSMSVAVLLLVRLDVVIVNGIAGPIQAGLFGAAARLGQVAIVAGLVWMAWLQPRMARQWHQRQDSALNRSLRIGLIGSVGMTSILVLAGWWIAPNLMLLMGKGFSGAVWPFRWLLLGSLVWGLAVPFNTLLSMSGREKLVSWLLWFQVLLTLGTSVPLVTMYGALGGSWAWAGGGVVANLVIVVAGLIVHVRRVQIFRNSSHAGINDAS